METVYLFTSEVLMFGGSSFGSLPPHFKRRGFHPCPHEFDNAILIDSKLIFNGFEGSSIFPSHFNDPIHLFGGVLKMLYFFGIARCNI
jgi:hypothetical protein